MDYNEWATVAALSAILLGLIGKPQARDAEDRKQVEALREFGFIK